MHKYCDQDIERLGKEVERLEKERAEARSAWELVERNSTLGQTDEAYARSTLININSIARRELRKLER